MFCQPSLKGKIERLLLGIQKEFQQTQGIILSESDLKCLLYSKLRDHFLFNTLRNRLQRFRNNPADDNLVNLKWIVETRDENVFGTTVHTEIPWYDEHHKLKIKPDITILNPSNLTILHALDGGLRLPSKQCEFGGKAIIFELKFCRNRKGIDDDYFKKEIIEDFNKIKRLNSRLIAEGQDNTMFCFFVIFNKTDLVCDEFRDFLNQNRESRWHEILYCSGKVTFSREINAVVGQ